MFEAEICDGHFVVWLQDNLVGQCENFWWSLKTTTQVIKHQFYEKQFIDFPYLDYGVHTSLLFVINSWHRMYNIGRYKVIFCPIITNEYLTTRNSSSFSHSLGANMPRNEINIFVSVTSSVISEPDIWLDTMSCVISKKFVWILCCDKEQKLVGFRPSFCVQANDANGRLPYG